MKRATAAAGAIIFLISQVRLFAAESETHPVSAADAETVKMVELFVKTPTERLPPSEIDKFLAVDPESLPKTLCLPYRTKNLELRTLGKLVAGKKKGSSISPEKCKRPETGGSDMTGTAQAAVMRKLRFEEISEDEERRLESKTHCSDQDMMCEFSLQAFVSIEGAGKKECRIFKKSQSGRIFRFIRAAVPGQDCDDKFEELKPGALPEVPLVEIPAGAERYYLEKGSCKIRPRFFLHPNDPLMALVAEIRAGARGQNTSFFGTGSGLFCYH